MCDEARALSGDSGIHHQSIRRLFGVVDGRDGDDDDDDDDDGDDDGGNDDEDDDNDSGDDDDGDSDTASPAVGSWGSLK